MSDAISFRPMTAADIDTVLKIEYAAFSHPWTRGIFTDSLTAYNCWVMLEGEQQVRSEERRVGKRVLLSVVAV